MSETIEPFSTSSKRSSKPNKGLRILLGVFLVCVAFVTLRILLAWFPPGPYLTCVRALEGAIDQWRIDNLTNGFPNVRGEASASLELLIPYMTAGAFRDYGYVAGLQPDDPRDLVLFYVKEPGRRRWHGDAWSPFQPKLWVVVNPQFSGDWEDADAISTTELKRRLAKTLVLLEKTQRSGWRDSVREHGKFLDSLRN
jgi:hypothetical protein